MIATTTTRFFVTRTTRLRAQLRALDWPFVGGMGVIALIIVVGLLRAPSVPQAPIVVFATPALPGAGHSGVATRPHSHVPIARGLLPTDVPAPTEERAAVAAPAITISGTVPTPAGYIAHTTAGDIVIPADATPVPNDGTYTGPFLAPAAEIAPPAEQPRLCTGYHDWRDYDAMYASSPICGQK